MNLGELVKQLKPYLCYAKYTDEKFLNELLTCIIKPCNVVTSDGDTFYFDKTYTSKIKNNHVDIPPRIREAALNKHLRKEMFQEFSLFYNNRINIARIDEMRKWIVDTIVNDEAFTDIDRTELSAMSDNISLLFSLLMKTLFVNNNTAITIGTVLWARGNSYIQTIYGDIFKYGFSSRRKKKNIVVIPVNTRFDTHLATKLENAVHPMISSETIHGEWLLRMEKHKGRIDDIPERIKSDLDSKRYKCNIRNEYSIGTIASIDIGNTCFYLVAISSFDDHKRANSKLEYIQTAVNSLLDYYDVNGQGYEMYIPLLGTGRSRAGMSIQESFDLIMYEIAKRYDAFHGKITIVVSNDNKDEINIGGDNL